MIYGYFTRILTSFSEEYEFRPPLKDYFEVIHSITHLDQVVYDTNYYRIHLKQLIDNLRYEKRTCKLYMLSLFNIGRSAEEIIGFLVNLPKNVELYIFDDKVDINGTVNHICTKHNSINIDDYVKVKIF